VWLSAATVRGTDHVGVGVGVSVGVGVGVGVGVLFGCL